MSTRGCVAIKKGDGWLGLYNHFDSYPTGLGREVWEHIRGKDLKQFAEELLRFDDWRNYLNEGVCEYCGKKGLGQPHSISGMISVKRKDQVNAKKSETSSYVDPEAKNHEHGKLEDKITPKNVENTGLEWIYVIDPIRGTMTVYRVVYEMGSALVVEIDLRDSNSPDWQAIENKGDEIYREMINRKKR